MLPVALVLDTLDFVVSKQLSGSGVMEAVSSVGIAYDVALV